ncbi:CAP domain-containing protein [Deinococcus multiflagellatus]|uniref:CAP domain-containing protein n=1 Tax=Deinococcus multiflagellatus TaxID=1656887 RepID=A0ABW1ZSG0_9DEIO
MGDWPALGSVVVTSGPMAVGGAFQRLTVQTPAPAGYAWMNARPYSLGYGSAFSLTVQPGAVQGEWVEFQVTQSLAGTQTFTLAADATLKRLSDGQTRDYRGTLKLTVTGGGVQYPLYQDVLNRAPTADEREVVRLINEARVAGVGCPGSVTPIGPGKALVWNDVLAQAARQHAADMVRRNYFSHDTPEGLTVSTISVLLGAAIRGGGGDNLGSTGNTSPREVVNGWLSSPGHCYQMMNPDRSYAGVGHADPNDLTGRKWVLNVRDALDF